MPKDTFFNLSGEKQEKVIRSAISEFLKHGFEKANVGIIAKQAGVAKGSIYQYFDNKKELFLHSVNWSMKLLMNKYQNNVLLKNLDIFTYFYETAAPLMQMLREEKEPAVFVQEVFLGRYGSVKDESMNAMLHVADEYVLKLVRQGKENGTIRKDIDDHTLGMFIVAVSMKLKENLLNKAKSAGDDIIGGDYEKYMNDIKNMMELLKNGMGDRTCL
ncbi:MAG TPA: TetR/AcrR family transcriptional regulator [Clostridia bacterium]|nr:TetR/AcrR family transcriptional regulator [Clostridia bacterium]